MDIVTLPALLGSTTLEAACDVMRMEKVSASIVEIDTNSHLLSYDRAIEIMREWAEPPSSIGLLGFRHIVPKALDLGDPLAFIRGQEIQVGEDWLDRHGTRFAILDAMASSLDSPAGPTGIIVGSVRVMTRFETWGQILRNNPVTYRCTVVARHLWTAQELKGEAVCPHITHQPPRPRVIPV